MTKAQEQVLREQVIDAERPGTVLRDFRMLLDFVGAEGVKAAGKYNLLPIDRIDELDQRLSRPLRLSMQRPLLRSHPYLQGLHLLLRANGLSQVEGKGAKARLVIDPLMLARWNVLNPTEQYFTLLEAWLVIGRPEMVGERGHGFDSFLGRHLISLHYAPAQDLKFDVSRPDEVFFSSIGRDFYLLALLDLFGLLKLEHPDSPVQPWCPAGLKRVPFGNAVFALLNQSTRSDSFNPWRMLGEPGEGPVFGTLQPIFQSYFPEWQNTLVPPAAEPRQGLFVFRVSLGRSCWRRIAIIADATLDELASAIVNSVGFRDEHLYQFSYRNRFGATVRVLHPFCEEGIPADEVRIGELPLEPGQSMDFLYDFGDNWQFAIKLESIEPAKPRANRARVLESHGEAPPQYETLE